MGCVMSTSISLFSWLVIAPSCAQTMPSRKKNRGRGRGDKKSEEGRGRTMRHDAVVAAEKRQSDHTRECWIRNALLWLTRSECAHGILCEIPLPGDPTRELIGELFAVLGSCPLSISEIMDDLRSAFPQVCGTDCFLTYAIDLLQVIGTNMCLDQAGGGGRRTNVFLETGGYHLSRDRRSRTLRWGGNVGPCFRYQGDEKNR